MFDKERLPKRVFRISPCHNTRPNDCADQVLVANDARVPQNDDSPALVQVLGSGEVLNGDGHLGMCPSDVLRLRRDSRNISTLIGTYPKGPATRLATPEGRAKLFIQRVLT